MSTSLPSPPAQEPSSPSAPGPAPLLAPIPQTVDESSADASSSLLITPTPSTAPPPPLPVTATPPPAPHPADDPAASALESIGAPAAGGSGGGLVDAGEVAAMEVEPASAPALSAASTSASAPSAGPGPTTSAPFVPPSPPPPRVDPTIALREFQIATDRRAAREDAKAMREGALNFCRSELRPNQSSPLDAYYIVPLLLLDLGIYSDVSVAVQSLSAWVKPHHYASGNPAHYLFASFATLISAVKTKTHAVVWREIEEIERIYSQPAQNEFDVHASRINLFLLNYVKGSLRGTTLAVVAELYESIPVAEFQRYTGYSREEALQYAQHQSYGFDAASDLLSPVPTPKKHRQATTTPHNFNALANGILAVEMRI